MNSNEVHESGSPAPLSKTNVCGAGNIPKCSCRLSLRRGEKNQHDQFLFDFMEVVLYSRCDENYAAFGHHVLLGRDAHASPPSNHIIQFIFFMRDLRIFPIRWQGVNPGTHRRHPQEFQIRLSALFAPFLYFSDIEEICQHLTVASLLECSEANYT